MIKDEAARASLVKNIGAKTKIQHPVVPKRPVKKAPMELDMGEGSREQGFLENGCR